MCAETRRIAEREDISEIKTLKYLFVMNNLTGKFIRVPYEWGQYNMQQWHFFEEEKFLSWVVRDGKVFVATEQGVVNGELA